MRLVLLLKLPFWKILYNNYIDVVRMSLDICKTVLTKTISSKTTTKTPLKANRNKTSSNCSLVLILELEKVLRKQSAGKSANNPNDLKNFCGTHQVVCQFNF